MIQRMMLGEPLTPEAIEEDASHILVALLAT
jgi:hypothetical protein